MAKILILEDDSVLRDLLRLLIRELGHETTGGPSLAKGPADFAPDLVITDLIGADRGYSSEHARAWVRQLRERFHAPVLVLTAHGDALSEPDMLGADAILAKPFQLDNLGKAVDRCLPS